MIDSIEFNIFFVMWLFTEFTKNSVSLDSEDSFIKRFIIDEISEIMSDSFD